MTEVCFWERRTNRIILRWAIPSAAGATKARKSDGVIQDGTARTPIVTSSVFVEGTAGAESAEVDGPAAGPEFWGGSR